MKHAHRRVVRVQGRPLTVAAPSAIMALVVLSVLLALLLGSGCATSSAGSSSGGSSPSPAPSASASRAPSASASPAPSASASAGSSTDCPELVFSDPEFAFELRRTMSAIYAGEADLGECLATAGRIKDGDFESWYREWHATAAHFHRVADTALKAGHEVTARQAYYRAATYYRTAEFFLHGDPDDPRIVETWKKGRDSFVAAAKLDDIPFERVKIPYDDTTLPGYFYGTDAAAAGRAPLLIIQTGFDGCQEELHPYAVAAVERGYDVLTFEGPGQGQVIRVQGIPFRADWEHVVEQVVDYAAGRPDVDTDRIGLWGISLGGYMAPRAAAFDHRLAACLSDGAVYDVGSTLLANLKRGGAVPEDMTVEKLQKYLKTDPKEFNQGIRAAMKEDTAARWQNEHGMYVFGVDSPALFWAAYMDFSLRGISEDITCPTLVCWGDDDAYDPKGRQAKALYRSLTCPRTIMEFTDQYEAGYHCQLGAFALSWGRKFDWLDDTLRPGA